MAREPHQCIMPLSGTSGTVVVSPGVVSAAGCCVAPRSFPEHWGMPVVTSEGFGLAAWGHTGLAVEALTLMLWMGLGAATHPCIPCAVCQLQ